MFSLRAGSVTGRDHELSQRNRQDGWAWKILPLGESEYLIGVVCDGCGSSAHSEVGAKLLAEFLAEYLLATVLGFVVGPEQTVIFAAGDGLVIVNDTLTVRDEGNAPHYLAYALLDESASAGFEVTVWETATIERLAIWTDGLPPELNTQIWQLGGPRNLQRQLNIWAGKQLLADDTTGIILERRKEAR
jgi:hypothetical protein